jgi:hypothetical protein
MTTWKRGINPIGPSVGEAVVIIHNFTATEETLWQHNGDEMMLLI